MPESTRDRERTFEAATAEEALSLVAEELGTDAEILAIERVTKGGIAGFFAKELVQIRARQGDDAGRVPARTARELEAPVARTAVAARASAAAAAVVRPEPVRSELVQHEAGRPVAGGVAGVLAQMLGQAEEREETFAEHLQARLATVPAGAPAPSVGGTSREAIDLTAFDNPSHQPTPQERVAALRREAERTRRGSAAGGGAAAAPAATEGSVRPATTTPDPAAQAAREEALRALILAEAAGGVAPAAPQAPDADVQRARTDALRSLVLDEARAAVRAAAEADPSPLALPAVTTSRVVERPSAPSAFEAAFGAIGAVDDDEQDAEYDDAIEHDDVAAEAPPTSAEIRAVEDRAAAAIAALRADRGRTAASAATDPAADMVVPTPAPAAPPMAPAEQVMATTDAAPEVRRPLWRLLSGAATDSHPGTGPVDWGVDALVHMGLPLALVRPAFELDPRDDLAWIEALAGAVATYCRPLPGGPHVLAGPRADRIGSAMGLAVTPFPEAPAYGGSVCLKTKADGPGRAWLSKVRGDRWLHVVAGGDWEDLVAKDPLAVSWVGLDALVPALQLCASRGLVLGYGSSGGPGAPVARAHPVEVALAIRSLVPRR
jgi:hypothetical protein